MPTINKDSVDLTSLKQETLGKTKYYTSSNPELQDDLDTLKLLTRKNQPYWKGAVDTALSPVKAVGYIIVGAVGVAAGALATAVGAVGTLFTAPLALFGIKKPLQASAALAGGGLAAITGGAALAVKGALEPITTPIASAIYAIDKKSLPAEKYAELAQKMLDKGYDKNLWEWSGYVNATKVTTKLNQAIIEREKALENLENSDLSELSNALEHLGKALKEQEQNNKPKVSFAEKEESRRAANKEAVAAIA